MSNKIELVTLTPCGNFSYDDDEKKLKLEKL